LLLITTNSEQTFPKMARPKGAISILGNVPLHAKAHITSSISFFRYLTLKMNQQISQ
jgi:hypothetical protein